MGDTHDETGVEMANGEWVSEALAGAVFPLPRKHVLWVAAENGVSPHCATTLQQLPEGDYPDVQSVVDALAASSVHLAESQFSGPIDDDVTPDR